MSEVIVLDVGHGNSAIVRSQGAVAVVDSPTKVSVLEALDELEISVIEAAFVSHTDSDHLAGILALLTSERVHVRYIYLNPDAEKKSKLWLDFRHAVSQAEKKGTCLVHTSLTTSSPGRINLGDVVISVRAPAQSLALSGVGGVSVNGDTITANTMSAVLCVEAVEGDGVLLCGDMDDVELKGAIEHSANLRASVLVFPHHGGLPGSADPWEFTERLLHQVRPRLVIFSNGRTAHDNPRPEIVGAVLAAGVQVACTQLSKRCCPDNLVEEQTHLEGLYSRGRKARAACAGSMSIRLDSGARRDDSAAAQHSEFISRVLPSAMCTKRESNRV